MVEIRCCTIVEGVEESHTQVLDGGKQQKVVSCPDALRSKKLHIELFAAFRGRQIRRVRAGMTKAPRGQPYGSFLIDDPSDPRATFLRNYCNCHQIADGYKE